MFACRLVVVRIDPDPKLYMEGCALIPFLTKSDPTRRGGMFAFPTDPYASMTVLRTCAVAAEAFYLINGVAAKGRDGIGAFTTTGEPLSDPSSSRISVVDVTAWRVAPSEIGDASGVLTGRTEGG